MEANSGALAWRRRGGEGEAMSVSWNRIDRRAVVSLKQRSAEPSLLEKAAVVACMDRVVVKQGQIETYPCMFV